MDKKNSAILTLISQKKRGLEDIYEECMQIGVGEIVRRGDEIVEKIGKLLGLVLKNQKAGTVNESFKRILQEYWKKKNFEEFCDIVSGWIFINNLQNSNVKEVREGYVKYLEKLQKYYSYLYAKAKGNDRIVIWEVLKKLEEKEKLFRNVHCFETPELVFRTCELEMEKNNLQETFTFLAKQHIIIGKYHTFEDLIELKQQWSCGLIIKFCALFGVTSNSWQKKLIPRQALIAIFKDHSTLNKSMNFEGFYKSFNAIACEYCNKPFDKFLKTSLNSLTVKEKRVLLLEKMRIGSSKFVQKTLKKALTSFADPDYPARIPLSHTCRTYKFTADFETKQCLKRLKSEKLQKAQGKTLQKVHSEADFKLRKRPQSHKTANCLRQSTDRITVYKHSEII